MTTAFFARLKAGDTQEAFTRLFDGTMMATSKPGDLALLIAQTETALKAYGKPLDVEFVGEKVLSPSIIKQTYLLKTPRGPLFWKFYFYRPEASWIVMMVFFDDNIRAALD